MPNLTLVAESGVILLLATLGTFLFMFGLRWLITDWAYYNPKKASVLFISSVVGFFWWATYSYMYFHISLGAIR